MAPRSIRAGTPGATVDSLQIFVGNGVAMRKWAGCVCTTTNGARARADRHHFNSLGNARRMMILSTRAQRRAFYGKTATFMPKPVVGDNGSGMHVHQSLAKGGQNLFPGNGYAGLSEMALHYIGGILKHAKALNAITNPGTNSYKRLVPGFEAPINLAYSSRNRSAAVRVPLVSNPKARRIEVRFPDPTTNPYLAFTAMLMAGLDGIQNKIKPGDPVDKNLYDLPPELAARVPKVCHSLEQALEELNKDRDFLTRGGVFSNDMLDAYVALKEEELTAFRMTTHPLEFQMYYSL